MDIQKQTDETIYTADSIGSEFKNKSKDGTLMEQVMQNYNISSKDYQLIFYDIKIKKRPMGVHGCKFFNKKRLYSVEEIETLKTKNREMCARIQELERLSPSGNDKNE